jgi:hypothetical protein
VGFADVDDEERRGVAIALIDRVQGGNLPPEGRSRVAAEDEDDGLLSSK